MDEIGDDGGEGGGDGTVVSGTRGAVEELPELQLTVGEEVQFLGRRWRFESCDGSLLTVRCVGMSDDDSIDAAVDAAKDLLERVRRMRNRVIVRIPKPSGNGHGRRRR